MRLTLDDVAREARSRLDPALWDFFEGGAGEERTLRANVEAFDRLWLLPRVLSGVTCPETATTILGRRWDAPVGIAPVAYQTLAHPLGELATVQGAAAAAVLPVVISTFAGRDLDELAAARGGPLWLQVYCLRDRSMTRGLIERAQQAGFEALVLTVDAPHLGRGCVTCATTSGFRRTSFRRTLPGTTSRCRRHMPGRSSLRASTGR